MKDEKLNNQEYPAVNREYKDRLFRFVFRKKEDLLSLYNAVNGTDYRDPDALEINTLENALYLGMKNDISFLISGTLNLYEHQSTYNPNMPVRGLMYFAKLYEKYIAENNIDIYTSTQKELPFPQYFVFYNGKKEEPDRTKLKLSDLFRGVTGEYIPKDSDAVPHTAAGRKEPCLECTATMLNINYGHNKELMEKCRRLKEYAYFVEAVRSNLASDMPLRESVLRAVNECIERDVLADILVSQKAEVVQMILETFDQEKHDEAMKKDWYEAGREDGLKEGQEEGRKEGKKEGRKEGQKLERENGIRRMIVSLRDIGIQETQIKNAVKKAYGLSPEAAKKYMEQYQVLQHKE